MAIISVHGLGKKFTLGAHRHDTLRDQLAHLFRRGPREAVPDFWALREVGFEVQPGEVIGIIGRNGAGKSTLLKILSQITEPTEGEIRLRGRTASLLEVGTGFHPELSGRENIFLNGAILGMRRAEITAKFDEIVAFAETEAFLDTPVKHYSSGMYMRLAFAVAAHLQPEILIVDEVLAVGDAAFQKKCLGKMSSVAREGRTILFVSHQMAAVAKLCGRVLMLEKGRLKHEGTPEEVIRHYVSSGIVDGECWAVEPARFESTAVARITGVELLDPAGAPLRRLATGEGFIARLGYAIEPGTTIPAVTFIFRARTNLGVEVFRLNSTPTSGFPIDNLGGTGTVDVVLPALPLTAGHYFFDAAVARMNQGFYHDAIDAGWFQVEKADIYGSGFAVEQDRGSMVVPHRWIVRRQGSTQEEDSGWIGRDLIPVRSAL